MAIAENGPKLSIERVVATMAPVLLLLRLISPCGRAGSGPGVPPGTHLLPSRSALFVVSGGFLFGRSLVCVLPVWYLSFALYSGLVPSPPRRGLKCRPSVGVSLAMYGYGQYFCPSHDGD